MMIDLVADPFGARARFAEAATGGGEAKRPNRPAVGVDSFDPRSTNRIRVLLIPDHSDSSGSSLVVLSAARRARRRVLRCRAVGTLIGAACFPVRSLHF